jgi:Arc/MetJ family transcription regulator
MGFKLNPYDPCVANSQIKGKLCTVAWYVDNNKISHVDDTLVTDVIEKIEAKFGKMTVTRGKHHLFLGMDITFTDDATVTLLMKKYLKEAIANSGMDASRVAATPAKRDLFAIIDKSEHLEKKK